MALCLLAVVYNLFLPVNSNSYSQYIPSCIQMLRLVALTNFNLDDVWERPSGSPALGPCRQSSQFLYLHGRNLSFFPSICNDHVCRLPELTSRHGTFRLLIPGALQGTFLTIRKHSIASKTRSDIATSVAASKSSALLNRRISAETFSNDPHGRILLTKLLLRRLFPRDLAIKLSYTQSNIRGIRALESQISNDASDRTPFGVNHGFNMKLDPAQQFRSQLFKY